MRIPTQTPDMLAERAYANPILAWWQEAEFGATVPQSKQKRHLKGVFFVLAAELGFEPRHTESESAVLPLHNSAR